MTIRILAIGKVREPALAELCGEYAERVSRYGHKMIIEEVREEPGGREPAHILEKEAERLRARLTEAAYTVALDREGDELDSQALAAFLGRIQDQGLKELAFLVGGHLGLKPELVKSCRRAISLSKLTFTHEMARLILLEQLYRANTILRGEPYHK
ncbi:MAG: hypothetical protein A3F83_11050 [Candidatus Glassbacteria bacterium RIFCSPLOWO2_12_FULL_58_11]|uniref:Ribosomal RNA large subunit methyltransferase H n=1 Tax=Candidatus Glassbacteria bacterium RIFCSPLOWO2_12_FULL_58_11 TaxID=1817867 RepID=A0A1F5YWV3_9BACT|nr:MAG: hypothetical protein A3F83_11050 [Candidatus Glassbacteria bacterium RIFCSPLOWO2_12_FULL_58_11]